MLLRIHGLLGCLVAFLLTVAGPGSTAVEAAATRISSEWRDHWEADLRFAQKESVDRHPHLFHSIDAADWNAEFDGLIERLPSMQHHQVVIELARVIARIEDGHTRLTLPLAPGIEFVQGHSETPDPHLPDLLMHQFPIRFSVESAGVYVRRIAAEHREVLGARVLELGQLDIDAAIEAVAPTIERDNEMQVQHHLPMHLVLAELLHARGVTRHIDVLPLEVATTDGSQAALELRSAGEEPITWADARDDAPGSTPLYLRHPERRFWFEALDDSRTVYFQFNEVQNEQDESLRDFAARLESFLAENDVENLIVDLRANRGGNAWLFRPLLHAIIRSDVNETGRLYTLIGRTTFSAAMMMALEMEKHTKTLFVGEDTGSKPNHYGDARKITLPNTGLTLRISTLYHQYDPTDVRRSIAPHIPVELTSEDYRNNHDPVLDTVFEIIASGSAGKGTAAGRWRGVATMGLNAFALDVDMRESPAPSAFVRMPDLELETDATDVHIEGQKVAFGIEWRERSVRFNGIIMGDWLIGEGDYQTVLFPFVLTTRFRP